MQIQQLSYFVAVARTRHFTRAAEVAGVSQPSLSKQIRVLENTLRTPLFVRRRGSVELTSAGEALLPLAERILIDVEAARRTVDEVVGMRRGRVRLGATPSLCAGLLAEALARFHDKHPLIRLEVEEGGSRDLTRALGRGRLDMALLIVPPAGDDPDLETTPILRESLVLASPVDRPIPGGQDRMPVAGLREQQLVMFREGYDLREVTMKACRDAGFEPRLAVDGGEMDAVLRFVEAGLGVAVVPSMVLATRPGLRGTTLDSPRLERTIAVAHRRVDTLPPTAHAFKRDLVDHLATTLSTEPGDDLQILTQAR